MKGILETAAASSIPGIRGYHNPQNAPDACPICGEEMLGYTESVYAGIHGWIIYRGMMGRYCRHWIEIDPKHISWEGTATPP